MSIGLFCLILSVTIVTGQHHPPDQVRDVWRSQDSLDEDDAIGPDYDVWKTENKDVHPEHDIQEPEHDLELLRFAPVQIHRNQNNYNYGRHHNSRTTRASSSHRTRRPRNTRRPKTTKGPNDNNNDWSKWIPSHVRSHIPSSIFQKSSFDNSFTSSQKSFEWQSYVPSQHRSFLGSFEYSSHLPSKGGSGQGSVDWHSYVPSDYRSFLKSYDYNSHLPSNDGSGQNSFNWNSYVPSEYRSFMSSYDYSSHLPSNDGSGQNSFNWNSYVPPEYRSFMSSYDYSSHLPSGDGSGQNSFNWHSYVPSEYRSHLNSFGSSESNEGSLEDSHTSFVSSESGVSQNSLEISEVDWHSYVPSEHRSFLKSFGGQDDSAWQSFVPSENSFNWQSFVPSSHKPSNFESA